MRRLAFPAGWSGRLPGDGKIWPAVRWSWPGFGFQPLEAVFALVGLTIVELAWRTTGTQP